MTKEQIIDLRRRKSPYTDLYAALTDALSLVDVRESIEDFGVGHYEYGSISGYDSVFGCEASLKADTFKVLANVINLPNEEDMEFFLSEDISDISETRTASRVVGEEWDGDSYYEKYEDVEDYTLFVKSLDKISNEESPSGHSITALVTLDIRQ